MVHVCFVHCVVSFPVAGKKHQETCKVGHCSDAGCQNPSTALCNGDGIPDRNLRDACDESDRGLHSLIDGGDANAELRQQEVECKQNWSQRNRKRGYDSRGHSAQFQGDRPHEGQ